MNINLIEEFRKKMENGQKVQGMFMKTTDPAFVEAAGYAGMDFAILDMEHGPAGIETMQNLIRAAQIAGILPVVRVPDISEEAIGKALDIGAAAIEVPQITSRSEAEEAVRLAKFYPRGDRGVCRYVRAAGYSAIEGEEYFKHANQTLVIAQLEGQEAIEHLDEILETDGIDIYFIGPYDLSQSLGLPGQVDHPEVIREMKKIVEAAGTRGKILGTFTDSAGQLSLWAEAGVQYLAYSVDVGIFVEACRQIRKSLKEGKS